MLGLSKLRYCTKYEVSQSCTAVRSAKTICETLVVRSSKQISSQPCTLLFTHIISVRITFQIFYYRRSVHVYILGTETALFSLENVNAPVCY